MKHILITTEQFNQLLENQGKRSGAKGSFKKLNKFFKNKLSVEQITDINSSEYHPNVKLLQAHNLHLGKYVSVTELRLINDWVDGEGNVRFKYTDSLDSLLLKAEQWHNENFKINTELRQQRKNVFLDLGEYYWVNLKMAKNVR